MTDEIQFKDNLDSSRLKRIDKTSKMSKFLIKYGIAKDVEHAQKVFLYSAIVFILATVVVAYVFVIPHPKNDPKVDAKIAELQKQGLSGDALYRELNRQLVQEALNKK